VLSQNLKASPDLATTELIELRSQPSASIAYNAGARSANSDVLVFAHQDVYLPVGWIDRLLSAIERLDKEVSNWGVLGLYGVRPDWSRIGRCWSSGLSRELGAEFNDFPSIVSADELLLVLNAEHDLNFDPSLPGFHLYGTDIVQTALKQSIGAFAIHNPVVHNSVPVRSLSGPYTVAYRYLQKKWRAQLPIPTCIVPLTRTGLPLWTYRALSPLQEAGRIPKPVRPQERLHGQTIAKRLGYE